ncbi:MAG TPA: hypothetical protein VKX49_11420 [Bryobacteraceae bacterium]|nr:hypothetical protein [Bryobacteraceae bacterium]
MTTFEVLIELAFDWVRDLILSILGRRAEEFVSRYLRRKRRRRNAKQRRKSGRTRKTGNTAVEP